MSKFKVGDLIVGTDEASVEYRITRGGVLCEVIKTGVHVLDYDMRVKVLSGKNKGECYFVMDDFFKLVEEENQMSPQLKEMIMEWIAYHEAAIKRLKSYLEQGV